MDTPLPSPTLQEDCLYGMGIQHQMQQTFAKETSKKELQFFRIINLQKIKVMFGNCSNCIDVVEAHCYILDN